MAELVTYTWTLSNIPPIKSEPYMAAENDYRATLRFQIVSWQNEYNFMSFVTTWEELGDELLNSLNEYMSKKDEVAKLTREITAGLTSPKEQSRALYKYVASQFETSHDYDSWYFVQKNVGELLAEKRGSGEGKNLLLVEMHNALGITAWPILISTRDHGQLDAGNALAAEQHLRELTVLTPNVDSAFYNWGLALLALNDAAGAVRVFRPPNFSADTRPCPARR